MINGRDPGCSNEKTSPHTATKSNERVRGTSTRSNWTRAIRALVTRSFTLTPFCTNHLIDERCDRGKLGNEVHSILVTMLPVRCLVHALGVGLSKAALRLQSGNSAGKLAHRVKRRRQVVDQGDNVWGYRGTGCPLLRQSTDLRRENKNQGKELEKKKQEHIKTNSIRQAIEDTRRKWLLYQPALEGHVTVGHTH